MEYAQIIRQYGIYQQERILAVIEQAGTATAAHISAVLEAVITPARVRRELADLTARGLIVRTGRVYAIAPTCRYYGLSQCDACYRAFPLDDTRQPCNYESSYGWWLMKQVGSEPAVSYCECCAQKLERQMAKIDADWYTNSVNDTPPARIARRMASPAPRAQRKEYASAVF